MVVDDTEWRGEYIGVVEGREHIHTMYPIPSSGLRGRSGNLISRDHVSIWNQFQNVGCIQPPNSFTYTVTTHILTTNIHVWDKSKQRTEIEIRAETQRTLSYWRE